MRDGIQTSSGGWFSPDAIVGGDASSRGRARKRQIGQSSGDFVSHAYRLAMAGLLP